MEGGRNGGREENINRLSPWPGIELEALWCTGGWRNQLTTLAKAKIIAFCDNIYCNFITNVLIITLMRMIFSLFLFLLLTIWDNLKNLLSIWKPDKNISIKYRNSLFILIKCENSWFKLLIKWKILMEQFQLDREGVPLYMA